jgi:chorismate synthase
MLSLPATKGFEIGSGFAGTALRGSAHNDPFVSAAATGAPSSSNGDARHAVLLRPATNNAGGTLGGISSGAPLVFRVAIKPVSTIGQAQVIKFC